MIKPIIVIYWKPVFNMKFIKYMLNNRTSMSVIKLFDKLALTPNIKYFSSDLKRMPLVLKKVLHCAVTLSNSLMEYILVVSIRSCGAPCKIVIDSKRYGWNSICFCSKNSPFNLIITVYNIHFCEIK